MKIKCSECRTLAKAIDAYIRKEQDSIGDELEEAGYLDAQDTVDQALDLEDNLAECMNVDTEIVADELYRADSLEEFVEETWETIQFGSALADNIQDIFENGFHNIIPRLINDYLHQTDMYLIADLIGEQTSDWMKSWSQQLGSLMKLTSHEKLGDILTDALRTGRSVADAAREILDSGIRDNYARSRQVALTEMLTAHSVARDEALMQSPSIEEKEWRHSGSRHNKPRKNHVAMDGTIVKKDEPFELTGKDGSTYKPMYPRDTKLPPGERINCHCVHRGIVSQSVLGLSIDRRRELQREAIERMNDRYRSENGKIRYVVEKAGDMQPIRKAANDYFTYQPAAPLKPTRKGFKGGDMVHQAADDVIDVKQNGGVSRYIYDGEGRLALRIDNGDHGFPKLHPFGHGGAHYVLASYDDDGNFTGWTRNKALTARMIASCSDILTYTVGTIKGGG